MNQGYACPRRRSTRIRPCDCAPPCGKLPGGVSALSGGWAGHKGVEDRRRLRPGPGGEEARDANPPPGGGGPGEPGDDPGTCDEDRRAPGAGRGGRRRPDPMVTPGAPDAQTLPARPTVLCIDDDP